MRIMLAFLLSIACLSLMAGCPRRETAVSKEEFIYQFDGSLPIENITLTKVSAERRDPIYTPRLRSQDYFELARRTFPADFVFDNQQLHSVGARSHRCDNPDHLDWMNFVWSVPDKQQAARRLVIKVIVDAAAGYVSSQWTEMELTQGDPVVMSQNQAINSDRAESVLRAAYDAFVHTANTDALRSASDCTAHAHISERSVSTWYVDFGSVSPTRVETYYVHNATLEVKRQR